MVEVSHYCQSCDWNLVWLNLDINLHLFPGADGVSGDVMVGSHTCWRFINMHMTVAVIQTALSSFVFGLISPALSTVVGFPLIHACWLVHVMFSSVNYHNLIIKSFFNYFQVDIIESMKTFSVLYDVYFCGVMVQVDTDELLPHHQTSYWPGWNPKLAEEASYSCVANSLEATTLHSSSPPLCAYHIFGADWVLHSLLHPNQYHQQIMWT